MATSGALLLSKCQQNFLPGKHSCTLSDAEPQSILKVWTTDDHCLGIK